MNAWATVTGLPTGSRIFNHGFDECVALANWYHEGILGGDFVPVNSAHEWWNNSYNQIDAIYTRSAHPAPGALFVARGGIYNTPHGHIGIVTAVHDNGTFSTLEQNAEGHRYVDRYTRSTRNVLGFLIPKHNPAGGSASGSQNGELTMADIKTLGQKLDKIISTQKSDKRSIDRKFTIVADIGRWLKARTGGSLKGSPTIAKLLGDNTKLEATAEEIAAAVVDEMGVELARDIAAQLTITTKGK